MNTFVAKYSTGALYTNFFGARTVVGNEFL